MGEREEETGFLHPEYQVRVNRLDHTFSYTVVNLYSVM
jgi:hypothetical protein